jgi:hypothetical protein
MGLPTERVQHGAARLPALGGGAVGRLGGGAASIWRDARALARGPEVTEDQPGEPSSEQVYFAWYGGLAAMALLRVIEWRLAGVIAAVHTVEHYAHRRRMQEFLEGIEAGGL